MKNIKGFSRLETVDYLRAYMKASDSELTWGRHPICVFIINRFMQKRARIMPYQELDQLKENVWQFVAYWYNKLGYHLPVDANSKTKLFGEFKNDSLRIKIEQRKIFAEKVIEQLCEQIVQDREDANDMFGIKHLLSFLNIRKKV